MGSGDSLATIFLLVALPFFPVVTQNPIQLQEGDLWVEQEHDSR